MAEKTISELQTVANTDNGDLFVIASPDQTSASGYSTYKNTMAAMANHIGTQVGFTGLNTTAQTLVGAINELAATGGGTKLTDTLEAGETELVFTDASILTTSMIDIYVDTWGVAPVDVVVETGEATLTFEAQSADVAVMLIVR